MTIKRQLRTRLLKALPDGTTEEHGIITQVPINNHSFESELHVHNELQKSFKEKLKKK